MDILEQKLHENEPDGTVILTLPVATTPLPPKVG